jgi:hypothetical protein
MCITAISRSKRGSLAALSRSKSGSSFAWAEKVTESDPSGMTTVRGMVE